MRRHRCPTATIPLYTGASRVSARPQRHQQTYRIAISGGAPWPPECTLPAPPPPRPLAEPEELFALYPPAPRRPPIVDVPPVPGVQQTLNEVRICGTELGILRGRMRTGE